MRPFIENDGAVLVCILAVFVAASVRAGGLDANHCTYGGIPLYGRVQFVQFFPDLTIQVVNSFPDLRVELVDAFPDRCGEWQVVDSFTHGRTKIRYRIPLGGS